MQVAHLALLAATALGWSDISVQPSRGDRTHAAWQRSVGALDRPSERTAETLRRYEQERPYRRNPELALAVLEKAARAAPDPDIVFALAELSWIEGRRLDRRRRASALDRFLDTVAYAHDFLFDPDLKAGRSPSDPRFRLACDLYNGALDRLIRAALAGGKVQPGDTIHLKLHGEKVALRLELKYSSWAPEDVDELIPASDLEVSGLASISRAQYGLGVPLIGVRRAAEKEPPTGPERFYPAELAFPLTAFLHPVSKLREDPDARKPRACTLDLVDPVRFPRVGQGADAIPLEADLTTPLAYMWSRTDLNRYRWKGLLRPGEASGRAGLTLLRPYDPAKIPVVMVHGLLSSPLAWIPMVNELLRDPQVRDRYQFLLYLYPTGMPLPIAAAGLRDALLQAEKTFSPPERPSPKFDQMVLLGHSMGGLLSHLMTVDSGNKFWQLNSDRRFDEIVGPPEVLAELEHYMFFRPLPFVKRVVFLATPHRGSEYSRNPVGRLGAGLINDPDHVGDLLGRLVKNNPDAFGRRRFRRMPTSIETLDVDSPVLLALLAMKPAEPVRFHSIIGSVRPVPVLETTDGVVPYRSSHIDLVPPENERVVRSDHGVQKDPIAILEVRRILLEHVGIVPRTAARPPATGAAR